MRLAGAEAAVAVAVLAVHRGFKALKQTVKLHYRLGNFEAMMTSYRDMLTYIKWAPTHLRRSLITSHRTADGADEAC